jgi:hypothetical protein
VEFYFQKLSSNLLEPVCPVEYAAMNFQLKPNWPKSQGQTVNAFQICVPEPMFSRDQLYVALWKGEVLQKLQKPENPSGSK